MRVRLTRDHRAAWNYQVVELKKDEEATGDLARYLLATGSPVSTVDDEAREAEDEMTQPASDGHSPAADIGRPLAGSLADQPPVHGSAEDVLTWVGHDQERAARAIGAEEDQEEPREELLEQLLRIHRPGPADDAFPEGGTAEEVRAWVGEDPERAQQALEAEEARDKPRSTLVNHLKKSAS
ncbi:hypothetical protein [Streptomyces lydicus]|uniref:hypothetical protein n=1 Tax=Streptomyces lydicus TaxID=47763 RepID=UPI00371CA29F